MCKNIQKKIRNMYKICIYMQWQLWKENYVKICKNISWQIDVKYGLNMQKYATKYSKYA